MLDNIIFKPREEHNWKLSRYTGESAELRITWENIYFIDYSVYSPCYTAFSLVQRFKPELCKRQPLLTKQRSWTLDLVWIFLNSPNFCQANESIISKIKMVPYNTAKIICSDAHRDANMNRKYTVKGDKVRERDNHKSIMNDHSQFSK